MELKISSLMMVRLSPSLSVVYTGHLFKRLVMCSIPLVSVPSEVAIVIIYPLIMEAAPGFIVFLVSSINRSSIPPNGLEYAVLRTWFEWLYLESQSFVNLN